MALTEYCFIIKKRADKVFGYIRGSRMEQKYVLDKILVTYNGNVVKTYQLKFNYRGPYYNKYSMLNEVIEYGVGNARLNSTAFIYKLPGNVSFSQTLYNTTHNRITHSYNLYTGDFNGDGKKDILSQSGFHWYLYASLGNDNFQMLSEGTFPTGTVLDICPMDLNGDNIDDIIVKFDDVLNKKLYYFLSDGNTFYESQQFCSLNMFTSLYNKYPYCGDIDGNGQTDYLVVYSTIPGLPAYYRIYTYSSASHI
jgi:hypothetical protein